MNWSAGDGADVARGFATETSTVPTDPAGEVAVICVGPSTMNDEAAATPKATAVAPVKPVPVTTTDVPPALSPEPGDTLLTTGVAKYVNWSAGVAGLMPPGLVTVTSTVTADSAGETAVIWVGLFTVNDAAFTGPNFTAVTDVKVVPVMTTEVPPLVDPSEGEIPVTAGVRKKVNWSDALGALDPPGVVTTTSTTCGALAGAVAVIVVSLVTVKLVAGVVPKATAVAPVKLVPVMVTVVPPAVGPEVGLTPVTVGTLIEGSDAVTRTAMPPEIPTGLWVADGCTAAATLVS